MKPTVSMLTNTDIENIHQCTLNILAKTGIVFHSEEALEILGKHGAKVDGIKAFFPEKLVEESLKTIPACFPLYGRTPKTHVEIGNDTTVNAPACGPIFVDEYGKGKRDATSEDYIKFAKLVQQSDFIDVCGDGIVYPKDIGTDIFHRFVMLNTIKYSDKPLMGLANGTEVSRECIEMARIALEGRRENIILGMAHVNSPLYYDKNMADGIIEYSRQQQPIGIASCSMAGFTAPVTLAGMLAVNNAEVLSGLILSQLINPGNPVIYGNTSTAVDMKKMGGLLLGAPETSLIITAAAELAQYYKIPYRSGGGLTGAASSNIQAGYEAMMSLYTTYLSGTHFVMHATGILDNFAAISFEKFIIDEEIGLMIKRYMKGITVDEESLAFDTINETGPCGNYVTSTHTFKHFRSELWMPMLSFSGDGNAITEEARKICDLRLERYERPALDEAVENRLNKYYEGL
jgi:trimethylamine---corrinoid protein Co-methyltransferase